MSNDASHMHLRLDDKTVEVVVQRYPEEVREPVMWTAGYMRERCNRQIAILQTKCKKLGFESDYSYWHKIFTGKYFQEGPDGKPQGSVKNLLRIVEALRRDDRIAYQVGRAPFIETPVTWVSISRLIDKVRTPGRVNKFAGVVGPTGSQKSASFREYASRNNHGKVVHIEAPEKPRMGQFVTDLARAYGESATKTMDRKISAITEAVNETKCIIVDNVQRLYKEGMGGDQPIFNFLQKLQDDTGCAVVMSFTKVFLGKLTAGLERGYFEQFVGRMGGFRRNRDGDIISGHGLLVLSEYTPPEDVLAIAEGFSLQQAEKHEDYLVNISRELGRVRTLFDDLQEAAQLAKGQNEKLTIAHVRAVRGEEGE